MKVFTRILVISFVVLALAATGCGPAKEVKTEPTTLPEPKPEPTIEELRQPVEKDATIYKAYKVIEKFGFLKKKAISFNKYAKLKAGGGAMDPDWFYDSHVLEINDKGYWMTFTLGTSKRAKDTDERIEQLMAGLPDNSIHLKMKTPSGKTYLLIDSQADGILDFVKDARAKSTGKVDIKLLDQMQEKYTWALRLVKKHYSKVK
jgi:hypothetical protein